MKKILGLVVLALFSAELAGCSYQLRSGASSLAGVSATKNNAKHKIFVPIVDNGTLYTGMEGELTDAVRHVLLTVNDLDLVNHSEEADFLLLVSLNRYAREAGHISVGTVATEAAGTLAENMKIVNDINLTMDISARLVEVHAAQKLHRIIWEKNFSKSGTFEASQRTSGVGASSAIHINDSREQIQVKILAQALAQQILDQVTGDF